MDDESQIQILGQLYFPKEQLSLFLYGSIVPMPIEAAFTYGVGGVGVNVFLQTTDDGVDVGFFLQHPWTGSHTQHYIFSLTYSHYPFFGVSWFSSTLQAQERRGESGVQTTVKHRCYVKMGIEYHGRKDITKNKKIKAKGVLFFQ